MKHLLSIFIMGSEVRQFVHSGLFGQLIDAGWKITVMSKIIDEDIRAQLPPGVDIVPLLPLQHSLFAETTTKILDQAFFIRRVRRGESSWKYGSNAPKNWREALLARFIGFCARLFSLSKVFMKIVAGFEDRAYKRYDRQDWKSFFRLREISAILVNVPRQPYWNPMLVTAEEMGIKSILLYHTNKDIIANPRLNQGFSSIGVWNERMKQELLRLNPSIDPASVHVVGCGHFDCVGRKDWLTGEEDFRSAIGALPDSKLILYPTAGPGIVPQEERYIRLVEDALKKIENKLDQEMQIIFRMNPMDNRDLLFDHLVNTYPEHITLRPDWQDIRRSNWTYARRSDPPFYNVLLNYCNLCITIPSTVTVDCAIAGTPIINLGIEVPGEQPLAGSIRAFWEVDFNRNVRESGAAKLVTSEQELEQAIIEYLMDKNLDAEQRRELIRLEVDEIYSGASSDLSFRLIESSVLPLKH